MLLTLILLCVFDEYENPSLTFQVRMMSCRLGLNKAPYQAAPTWRDFWVIACESGAHSETGATVAEQVGEPRLLGQLQSFKLKRLVRVRGINYFGWGKVLKIH